MANTEQSQVSCGFNVSFPANMVAFSEEILNGKLHFFCSESMVVINILLAVNDFKYHVLFFALVIDDEDMHLVTSGSIVTAVVELTRKTLGVRISN